MVFDTRDALTRAPGRLADRRGALAAHAARRASTCRSSSRFPRDHVLTKTFYLLDRIVGRTAIGQTWIEALPPPDPNDRVQRPARAGDSVSPIIIASDDLAAAWARTPRGGRSIR